MCGIFGAIGAKEAARLTYLGLYALQHRGEESAGIAAKNKNNTFVQKGMGLVNDIFDEQNIRSLKGNLALGHVRYSTTGASIAKNIQPFLVNHRKRPIAIAHNGNLLNTLALYDEMEKRGSIFQTTMDSEIIAHLIAASTKPTIKETVIEALGRLEGAYSLVLMVDSMLIGARDPYGFRPLCLGKLNNAYVLASETCALDLIQAQYVRDIEPGEIVFISENNIESVKPYPPKPASLCIFEYIYFARPDSNIFTKNVYLARKNLGRNLAKEFPRQCDFVMPIPDSGSYAACGFAQELNLPLEAGMIRNHYVGRTFIQPTQTIRAFRVKVKLNPIKEVLKDKRAVVIEDSIVRGTTSRTRVKALREAGLKEIHMRVSCPPLRFPCFYGIDFPTKKELIANKRTVKEIGDYIGVDSLEYLSLEGMLAAMPLAGGNFCTACFTGRYPTQLPNRLSKTVLEKRG